MSSTRFTNLIIVLISSLMTLAVLELLIRQMDTIKGKALSKGYSQLYSDERTTSNYIFGHHPNISTVLSDDNFKFRFTTNSQGLRERENYSSLDNSVIFVGDSVIEGMVNDHETIDEYFEEISNVTSLNFGLGSSNTIQEYFYLKEKYKDQYNTSIVILGVCVNDIKQNNFLRAFNEDTGNWELLRYIKKPKEAQEEKISLYDIKEFFKYSRVFMFTYSSIKGLFVDTKNYSQAHSKENFTQEEIQNTIYYIEKMHSFLDSKNIEFFVTILPTRDQIESNDLHLGIQGEIERSLIKKNINVINIDRDVILLTKEEGAAEVWLDNIHFKAKGNQLVASSIYNYLKENRN